MSKNLAFTIATYNIQFAINRKEIIENIVHMAKNGVDIFCLQEIINEENKVFVLDVLLEELGDAWKAEFHAGNENSKESIGTAILWKKSLFSLNKTAKILLPKINRFDLHEKLYYKVIGIPGVVLQRRAISCVFTYKERELCVSSVHIDNVGGPGHRMKQVSYFLDQLTNFNTSESQIICGDFNTFDLLKTGYEKQLLQNKLGNDFIDASKNIDWTSDIYNINFSTSIKIFHWFIKTFNVHIRRRLDYIWVKNLKPLDCKKFIISGSDHYPVIAQLQID